MRKDACFELNALENRMSQNLEMRHTYLMFSFTTTAALIAAVFAFDASRDAYYLCLVPFSVIIPFQARVSYSRLSHARMEAYIKVFYSSEYPYFSRPFNELYGIMGKFIELLVNYELTILSVTISICYFVFADSGTGISLTTVAVPLILTLMVAITATYTKNYQYFVDRFEKEYKEGYSE